MQNGIESYRNIPPGGYKPGIFNNRVNIRRKAPKLLLKDKKNIITNQTNTISNRYWGYLTDPRRRLDAQSKKLAHTQGFEAIDEGKSRILEHPLLPGYIIKLSSKTPLDATYRVLMAKRMSKVKEIDDLSRVLVPAKGLHRLSWANEKESTEKKYIAFAEKIELVPENEQFDEIRKLPEETQREMAVQACKMICGIGYRDAHAGNIRLTRDGRLAFIDTEPLGMFVEKEGSENEKPGSILNEALSGLEVFNREFGKAGNLPIFQKECEKAIADLQTIKAEQKAAKKKVGLSSEFREKN